MAETGGLRGVLVKPRFAAKWLNRASSLGRTKPRQPGSSPQALAKQNLYTAYRLNAITTPDQPPSTATRGEASSLPSTVSTPIEKTRGAGVISTAERYHAACPRGITYGPSSARIPGVLEKAEDTLNAGIRATTSETARQSNGDRDFLATEFRAEHEHRCGHEPGQEDGEDRSIRLSRRQESAGRRSACTRRTAARSTSAPGRAV